MNANSSFDRVSKISRAATEALDVVLEFGSLMLQSGNTAVRTREWMEVLARKLAIAPLSVSLTLDAIAVSVRGSERWMTAMREVRPAAINACRIGELEQLARTVPTGTEARAIREQLAEIEAQQPAYSPGQIVAGIGLASAGFAFLNGGTPPELVAAAIGGGIGQWSRAWLGRQRLNYFGAAALSAVVASAIYFLASLVTVHFGAGPSHVAGITASVLFLVPGFPLIASLFDLLQHQKLAAVSRLADGIMTLLAVALGLSVVIAVAKIDLAAHPSLELAYPLTLLFRGVRVSSVPPHSPCCSTVPCGLCSPLVCSHWSRTGCAWCSSMQA